MQSGSDYDVAVIGGGVAGLAFAILVARAGRRVILFEKESYPFHKVCGEYISNESIPFLRSLGVELEGRNLPQIAELFMSAPSGLSVKRPLDIGGTGLSRYALDGELAQLATAAGVQVQSGVKVQAVRFEEDRFLVDTSSETVSARVAIGAYGKASNIDAQLRRKYKAPDERSTFIAVKHHIRADFDERVVEMHNFPGGYCGMSAIEDGKVNMSYISRVANLKAHGSIAAMERQVLSTNPFLKKYFDIADFLFEKPLTISHLYFEIREPVVANMLLPGDAAGSIAPLSGNGMSMAFQSAKIAASAVLPYLSGDCSRAAMEERYTAGYRAAFSRRITIARSVNFFFGKPPLTDLGFLLFKLMPSLVDMTGSMIHGKPF